MCHGRLSTYLLGGEGGGGRGRESLDHRTGGEVESLGVTTNLGNI